MPYDYLYGQDLHRTIGTILNMSAQLQQQREAVKATDPSDIPNCIGAVETDGTFTPVK